MAKTFSGKRADQAPLRVLRTRGGNQYTALNLTKRLGALKQDPWQDIGRLRQKLPREGSVRGRRS